MWWMDTKTCHLSYSVLVSQTDYDNDCNIKNLFRRVQTNKKVKNEKNKVVGVGGNCAHNGQYGQCICWIR